MTLAKQMKVLQLIAQCYEVDCSLTVVNETFTCDWQVEELQQNVGQVEKQSSKKVKQLQDLLRFLMSGVSVMLCYKSTFT